MKPLVNLFNKAPIRSKLLFGYSGTFILALGLGSILLFSMVKKTIETNIESELKSATNSFLHMIKSGVAASIRNHLRAVAEKNKNIISTIYTDYQQGRLSETEAKTLAKKILLSQKIGETGYIYCINSSGIIKVHPKPGLHEVDLSPHAFIREQTKKKQGYIEYDWANPDERIKRPKALYMTYFEPWDWIISVSSYREEFRELFSADDFEKGIMSITFGKTGYTYVIDSKGNLIIHPKLQGTNIYHSKDAKGRMFIKELCEKKSGKIIYPWKNPGEKESRLKLVIFNYIPELDWIIASSNYLEEFYQPLKSILYAGLATVFLIIILVIPVTLWISRSINRPINELVNCFDAGAKGDLTKRIDVQWKGELGALAQDYNTFVEQLESSRDLLVNSEKKFRSIFNNATEGIFRLMNDGGFLSVNRAMAGILGHDSPDHIIGKFHDPGIHMPDFFHDKNDWKTVRKRLSEKGRIRNFETRVVRKNKSRIWVSVNAHRVFAEDENEILIEGTFTDITQQKKAINETRRLGLYLENIINAMPSALVGIDNNNTITLWNKKAVRLTKIPSEKAVGKNLYSVSPLIMRELGQLIDIVLKIGLRKNKIITLLQPEKKRTFEITVYPLKSDIVFGAVIRLDDITEKVRLEEVMIQTEKMMSVGGLAAGMAHEINNPLAGIMQNIQVMKNRISLNMTANESIAQECGISIKGIESYLGKRGIFHMIDSIMDSGKRAAQIVENMLSFSRKTDSYYAMINLAELLDKTIDLSKSDYDLKKKFDFKLINIKKEYSPDTPLVKCEEGKIQQVFLNIIKNGAQAMAEMPDNERGARKSEFIFRTRKEKNHVCIDIKDNGPGMSLQTRKRVFEPFFTTKEVGSGTGLGLSVSYFIIKENHNGELDVKSAPGKGTCFTIRLPINGPATN